VNITLSADEKLVAKARAYAEAHNTTLNQLLRDYMERITGMLDGDQAAREFIEFTRSHAGRSEPGFRFDRNAIHERGGRK
jgi:uncharacterized protein YhdP